jgi:pilus assembly protein Flp/PilA
MSPDTCHDAADRRGMCGRGYRSDVMLGRLAHITVQFLKKEDGPTAVEYAVMLALIIAVCVVAVMSIGGQTSSMYSNLSLQAAVKPGGS